MFITIELLGLLLLLYFICNFIHYAIWASSGYEGPRGAMFGLSNRWIKDGKASKAAKSKLEKDLGAKP